MKTGKSSRHPDGTAVDVDMINGKPVSKKIEDAVEKFNYELEKLGYKRNVERGTKKAFLTFGFEDHDDHVHVSNKTDVPTEDGEESTTTTTTTTSTETDSDAPRFNLDKVLQTVKDFRSGIGF